MKLYFLDSQSFEPRRIFTSERAIAHLNSCNMLRLGIRVRSIHSSASTLLEKTVIPSIILEELKNSSRLASNNKKKQIFLNPNEIVDKKLENMKHDLSVNQRLKGSTFSTDWSLFDDVNVPQNTFSNLIDELKPSSTIISRTKYLQLKDKLANGFKKNQLSTYVSEFYSVNPHLNQRVGSRTKAGYASKILDDVWQIKPTDSDVTDFYTTLAVKLSKTDLFLLLSEKGFLIQYLARAGVKISLDAHDGIKFTGIQSHVRSAEILLASMLSKALREKIDLSYIKSLFLEKYNEFLIDKIIKNTEVSFEQIEDDTYELISINPKQFNRAKRLLVWLLNYNDHIQNHLIISNTDQQPRLLPFKDDESLSWDLRLVNLFKLEADVTRSESIARDFERFEFDSNKTEQILADIGYDISRAKSGSHQMMELESWNLLQKLGITQDPSKTEPESSKPMTPEEDTVVDQSPSISEFTDEEIDDMYSKLTDFQYRKNLCGEVDSNLNPPIFTITFGNILFESEDTQTINHLKYQFNTNIPLMNDKALSLPLFEQRDLSIKDINHFINNDPHTYAVQLKFLPSPYGEDHTEHMKYPPVEIWADLINGKIINVESMNVVTVEGENNVYLSRPNAISDFKICCQVSGNLIQEVESETVEEEPVDTNIHDILHGTSKRYSKISTQPGLKDFLENSKINFKGHKALSVHPYVDLIINGETVRYNYVNLLYRRQMDFAFGDRLLQLNIVEGGALGGRKIEINMIGDLNGDISKEEFVKLLSDAKRMAEEV